jgi:hypothetical protein
VTGQLLEVQWFPCAECEFWIPTEPGWYPNDDAFVEQMQRNLFTHQASDLANHPVLAGFLERRRLI